MLTHQPKESLESPTFIALAGYLPYLLDTLNETAPERGLKKANSMLSENTADAISKLGRTFSISSAFPSILYLAMKYDNDIETAFIENAMAAGDNFGLGLALGIL